MHCIEIISSLSKLYNSIDSFCTEFLLKPTVYSTGKQVRVNVCIAVCILGLMATCFFSGPWTELLPFAYLQRVTVWYEEPTKCMMVSDITCTTTAHVIYTIYCFVNK